MIVAVVAAKGEELDMALPVGKLEGVAGSGRSRTLKDELELPSTLPVNAGMDLLLREHPWRRDQPCNFLVLILVLVLVLAAGHWPLR